MPASGMDKPSEVTPEMRALVAEWQVERMAMGLRIMSGLLSPDQLREFWARYERHQPLLPAPSCVVVGEEHFAELDRRS
jgi:hypothetical protein